MSDLLKESIADAKAVRETAIANAKTFLEENFAKSMKEMFAEKLKEDMTDEPSDEDQVDENLSTSKIGGEKGNVSSKQHPVKPSSSADKSTTSAGKQEFDAKLEEETSMDDEEVTSEELDEILAELEGEVVSEEMVEDDDGEVMGSESDSDGEEVNLDELLAELEMEEQNVDPMAVAPPAAPVAPVDPMAAVPAPTVPVAPVPGQVPSPSEGEVTYEEMAEALVAINEENEALKNQLSEHINTVKYLKGVLAETNLLNAKLLYTNKLFKGKSLTEDHKLKIINTFDLTRNIREVKLAYTVLAESFNSGGSVVKKKTNATVSTITEGLASKPVSSTKPVSTIVEPHADEMTSRFQKLAGIKK
jgi:hypothetical protein